MPRELREAGVEPEPVASRGPRAWPSTPKSPTTSWPRFIASYDLGALLSYKGIAEGVENTNYLVHTEKGPFILTLYEKRVAPADLPFFLGLMEHLAQGGLTCPTPVRDARGPHAARAGGPAGGARHLPRGRVDPAAAGAPLLRPSARPWRGCIWRARASSSRRANALGLAGWRPLFEQLPRARRRDRARPLPPSSSRSSTIWKPTGRPTCRRASSTPTCFPTTSSSSATALSGLIDFYFACNDAFAYDVAIMPQRLVLRDRPLLQRHQGPGAAQGLPERAPARRRPSAQALPLLARGAALRFLLTRAYDWLHTPSDALVSRKDPLEYLRRLRFHRSIRSASEYGLEDATR